MAPSKAAKKIIDSIKPKSFRGVSNSRTPLGQVGYDNPRDDIERVKKLREGSVEKVPVFDNDIVNKKYHDDNTPSDITDLTAGNWKVFHSDGAGDVKELSLTNDPEKFLKSVGDAQAPEWIIPNHDALTNFEANEHFTAVSVMQTIYPVGGIYISTLSTNPNTLLGFGTWATFGAGKVLVSLDSGDADFDTSEETGGAKTHTHAVGTYDAAAESSHTHSTGNQTTQGPSAVWIDRGSSSPQGTATNTHDHLLRSFTTAGGSSHDHALSGSSASGSGVQPYIVVYMWKRTA